MNKPNPTQYISLQEASKLCSYSQEYLSLRARQGKLKAVKMGRNWVTSHQWLNEYINSTQYISLQAAAEICPYSQEYLSLRARQKKLKAIKLRGKWVTTQKWLDAYVREVGKETKVEISRRVISRQGIFVKFDRIKLEEALEWLIGQPINKGLAFIDRLVRIGRFNLLTPLEKIFLTGLRAISQINWGLQQFYQPKFAISAVLIVLLLISSIFVFNPGARAEFGRVLSELETKIANFSSRLSSETADIAFQLSSGVLALVRDSSAYLSSIDQKFGSGIQVLSIQTPRLIESTTQFIEELPSRFGSSLKRGFQKGITGVLTKVKTLPEQAQDSIMAAKNLADTLSDIPEKLSDIDQKVGFLIDVGIQGIPKIPQKIVSIYQQTSQKNEQLKSGLKTNIKQIPGQIVSGIQKLDQFAVVIARSVKRSFTSFRTGSAISFFTNIDQKLGSGVQRIAGIPNLLEQGFNRTLDKLDRAAGHLAQRMSEIPDRIQGVLVKKIAGALSLLRDLPEQADVILTLRLMWGKNLAASIFDSLTKQIIQFPQTIKNKFSDAYNKLSEFLIPDYLSEQTAVQLPAKTPISQEQEQETAQPVTQTKQITQVKEITQEKITEVSRVTETIQAADLAKLNQDIGTLSQRITDLGNQISSRIDYTTPSYAPIYVPSSGIQVAGHSLLSTLNVTGSGAFGGSLAVKDNAAFGNTKDTNTTFDVYSDATFHEAVNFDKSVSADSFSASSLSISGNGTITGTFSAATTTLTYLIVSNNATTTGSHYVGGDFSVLGNASTTGDLTVGGDLIVAGAQTYSGAASFTATSTSPALSVRQNSTGHIVDFKDGDTSVFTILDGGNVGIGTTTPDYKLSVAGQIYATSTDNQLILVNDLVNSYYSTFSVDNNGDLTIDLATSNATVTVADNFKVSGNATTTGSHYIGSDLTVLGYGTTTAGLYTQGSGHFGGDLTIDGSATSTTRLVVGSTQPTTDDIFWVGGNTYISGSATTTGSMYIGQDLTVAGAFNQSGGTVSYATTTITGDFTVQDYGGSNTHLYVENNSGNVGIGTAGPGAKLEIKKQTATTNSLQLNTDGLYRTSEQVITQDRAVIDYFMADYAAEQWRRVLDIRVRGNADGTYGDSAIRFFTNDATLNSEESERMRIDGNGNVGIGTTTPWGTLAVGREPGDSTTPLFNVATTTAAYATSSAFIVTADGNVGIGTAAPGYKLEINSPSSGATIDVVQVTANDGSALMQITESSGGSGLLDIFDASENNDIRLYTDGFSYINTGYNVGIGTDTSPDYLLDVQGTFHADGESSFDGNVGIGTTTPDATLAVTASAGSLTGNELLFQVASTTSDRITNNLVVTADGNVGIGTAAPTDLLTIETGNSDATGIRIDGYDNSYATLGNSAYQGINLMLMSSNWDITHLFRSYGDSYINSGNVGIGTTTPDYKLSVAGQIYATSTSNQLILVNDLVNSYYSTFSVDNNGDLTIDLATTNATTTFSENVVISGNLGGSSPLNIVTDLIISANATTTGYFVLGTTNPTMNMSAGDLLIGNNATTTGSMYIVQDLTVAGTFNQSGGTVSYATTTITGDFTVQDYGGSNTHLYIENNSGNVGIGTAAPDDFLEIEGALGGKGIHLDSSTGVGLRFDRGANTSWWSLGFETAGTGNWLIGNAGTGNNNLAFIDDDNSDATPFVIEDSTPSDTLYLDSTGNVGIGTTTPKYLLTLEGTTNDLFQIATTTNQGIFVVDSDGNVGIGTTSPSQKLDVNGNINVSAGSAYMYNRQNAIIASTTANNWFFGGAGNLTMTGSYNIGFGPGALVTQTTGINNVAIGYNALQNSTNYNSTGIGYQALQNNYGASNTGIGYQALLNGSGNNNTCIGFNAGSGASLGNWTSGSNNIIIGNNIDLPAQGSANMLSIGNLIYATGLTAFGSASNSISTGNVGIGTTTPWAKLSIAQGASDTGPLFTISTSTDGLATTTAFHIDNHGNVGIGTASPGEKLAITDSGRVALVFTDSIASESTTIGQLGNDSDFFISRLGTGGDDISLQPDGDLIIGQQGNVGIGTTNPTSTLMVIGNLNIATTSALTTNKSVFFVDTATGNVGIGTAAPSEMLDVDEGRIKVQEDSDYILLDASDGSGNSLIQMFNNGSADLQLTAQGSGLHSSHNIIIDSSGDANINIRSASGGDSFVFWTENTQADRGVLGFAGGSGDLVYRSAAASMSAGNERFRITEAGSIGIGTTTPWGTLAVGREPGDSTTPLFNVATTTAAYATSSAFIVTADGFVGIGTAEPSYELQILAGDSETQLVIGNSGSGGAYLKLDAADGDVSGNDYLLISHENDLTASIRTLSSAGDLWLGAAGAEVLRLTTGGNVGIGTTTPWAKLSIAQGASDTGPLFTISTSTDGLATTTAFHIDNHGNVGIGTAAPNYTLTVQSNFADGTDDYIENNYAGGGWGYSGFMTDGDYLTSYFRQKNLNSDEHLEIRVDGKSGETPYFNIVVETAEIMRITNDGNVGIGTTTPQTALHIGTASTTNLTNFSDSLMISGELEVGQSAYLGPMEFDTNAGVVSWIDMPVDSGASANTVESYTARIDGTNILTIYAESDGSGGIQNNRVGVNTTTPDAALAVTASAGSLTGNQMLFHVASTTNSTINNVFLVTADGNVGIGTAGPGKRLEVFDNVLSEESIGSGGGIRIAQDGLYVDARFGINFKTYLGQDYGDVEIGVVKEDDSGSERSGFYIATKVGTATDSRPIERLRIDYSGNVGIGTTSPEAKLELNKTSGAETDIFQISSTTSGDLIVVDHNGNVGIGTTAPGAKLEVSGGYIRVPSGYGYLWNDAGSNTGQVIYDYTNGMRFVSGGSEKVRIQSDGNVGIGTTTPDASLAVTASAGSLTGNELLFQVASTTSDTITNNLVVTANGNVGIGTAAPKTDLNILRADAEIQIEDTGNGGILRLLQGWNYAIVGPTTSHGLSLQTASADRVYIDTSGNVGIGTTSPEAKLELNKTSGAETDIFQISSTTSGDLIVVDHNGNVGIGTTSPATKLDVWGAAGTELLRVTENSTSWGSSAGFGVSTADTRLGLEIFVSDGPVGRWDSNGGLNIGTGSGYWDGDAPANGLAIQGNVGIGTTTPKYNLSIEGTTNDLFQIATTTNQGIFVVDSDGNVGIGTAAPGAVLDIDDSSGINLITLSEGGSSKFIVSQYGQITFGSDLATHSGDLNLIVNSLERITIKDSTGNVGIGTTTPDAALAVTASAGSKTGSELLFQVASTTSDTITNSLVVTADGKVGIGTAAPASPMGINKFLEIESSMHAGIVLHDSTSGAWEIYANGDDLYSIFNGTTYGWTIDGSTGNVGIGTTDPGSILHIKDANPELRLEMTAGRDTISFHDANPVEQATIDWYNITGDLTITNNDADIILAPSGNVGIGTTSPDYALQVDGTIAPDSDGQLLGLPGLTWTLNTGDIIFANDFKMTEATTTALLDALSINNASNTPLLYLVENGYVGIATTTPTNILTIGQGMGNAIADGWDVYSSEEYKTDITYLEEQDYDDILEQIGDMELARWKWKDSEDSDESGTVPMDISTGTVPVSLGIIAEQAPEQVLGSDGKSISLYDYTSYALAGVKALDNKVEEIKALLNITEDGQGNLVLIEEGGEPVIVTKEGGEECQLKVDEDGYVVLEKLKVQELEIVQGGQLTLPEGPDEIVGQGLIATSSDFVIIENSKIATSSKIFISFTSNLAGASWWVCDKVNGESFKVCLSEETNEALTFDYWIVQTRTIVDSAVTETVTVPTEVPVSDSEEDNFVELTPEEQLIPLTPEEGGPIIVEEEIIEEEPLPVEPTEPTEEEVVEEPIEEPEPEEIEEIIDEEIIVEEELIEEPEPVAVVVEEEEE